MKLYFNSLYFVILCTIHLINAENNGNARLKRQADSSTCGIKVQHASKNEYYPWHVGIYTSDKNHICGGSIINQRIVLSAAHCFTDIEGSLYPKENYLVASGKRYREYQDSRDENAQYSQVAAIHVPKRYKGIITNFEADIAVIILEKPFQFSRDVQSVCIDWKNEFEDANLKHGTAVGWGYTIHTTEQPQLLKEVNISFVSHEKCFEEVPNDFKKYITYDKMCTKSSSNDASICNGDGGEGVSVIWNNENYFMAGIISVSQLIKSDGIPICTADKYIAVTLISKYLQFINSVSNMYKA